MTEHLIYWRKAKITDVVTLRNTYQLAPLIRPQADLTGDSETVPILAISNLSEEFSIAFPHLPHLVSILSFIGKRARQPFLSILPGLDPGLDKSESMAVLVWLLKHDLISRERTHVRLKIDAHTKAKVKQILQHRHTRSEEDLNEQGEQAASVSPESHLRVSGDDPTSCSSSRYITGRPLLIANRVGSHTAASPLLTSLGSRSVSNFQRHSAQSSHPMIAQSLPPIATRSTSDRSVSHLSAQNFHRLESASAESMPSSNELRRRRRRRMRQLSVQSSFSNTEPGGLGDEFEDQLTIFDEDEEDEILGEPGMATALQRRWLDELCHEKPEAIINSFNMWVAVSLVFSLLSTGLSFLRGGEKNERLILV